MKNTSRRKARESAFQVLYQRNKIGVMAEETLILDPKELDQDSLTFSRNLIDKCWENMEEVDNQIQQNLKDWKQSRLSETLNAVLRLATSELLFFPETDGKVVINEALELCRAYLGESPVKMCNGVLHGIWSKQQ